jgi:peptide deformylase
LWNRRKFLKLAITGLIATTGIFSFLKGYKQKNQILDIVEYPNPILRGVSETIDFIDDSSIILGNSLISLLRYKAPFEFFFKGSLYKGLAAPQVGIQKRLIACGLHGEIKILINPEILEKKGTYSNSEYCLSLPQHHRQIVKRSQYVTLKYTNLENTEKILVAKNGSAALLEHEMDHLDGVLYIDY